MEEPTDAGYPTSDNISDTLAAKYAEFGSAMAHFAHTYSQRQTFNSAVPVLDGSSRVAYG